MRGFENIDGIGKLIHSGYREQFAESNKLEATIEKNLKELGYGG